LHEKGTAVQQCCNDGVRNSEYMTMRADEEFIHNSLSEGQEMTSALKHFVWREQHLFLTAALGL